jgi:hypothetical protein
MNAVKMGRIARLGTNDKAVGMLLGTNDKAVDEWKHNGFSSEVKLHFIFEAELPLIMLKSLFRFLSPRFQNLFLEYKVDFKPRYGHGLAPHAELLSLIEDRRDQYAVWIEKALRHREALWAIKKADQEQDSKKAVWNNGFLPGLDIAMIYTFIAECKPKKYVEVGSGNSTKVAYKAVQEHQLDTKIISIDPQPRAEIDALAHTVLRMPFENSQINLPEMLEEGDILFIDNSHRILPNSDAMVFFMEVLPRLKKGVWVHLHDIYLPFDYPDFMCDRFYSEQYGLAMYLLANPKRYATAFPNYFVSEDPSLSKQISPLWNHENLEGVERHGGSYWIRIED